MISLPQLHEFLDELMIYNPSLDVSKIDQKNANGLQVKGSVEIKKVGLSVTASLQLFQKAKEIECDTIIVHHGLRWPSTPHYQKAFQRKYSFLVKNNISLFGYHFLLDSHPEIGHNELILRNLGIEDTEVYLDSGGPWGRKGAFDQPQPLNEILEQCRDLFKREDIISYKFGKEVIQNVAAVSGSGAPYGDDLQRLMDQEIDLYITGEAKESTRELFREAEKNFIGAGHYATERLGIIELEQQIKDEFSDNVETEFIELWNDV